MDRWTRQWVRAIAVVVVEAGVVGGGGGVWGGGAGGGAKTEKPTSVFPANEKDYSNSYEKYINETFESRSRPPSHTPSPLHSATGPRTSRAYSTARVSARAGR